LFPFLKRTIKPLIGPGAILALAAIAIFKWPGLTGRMESSRELEALVLILPFLPYALFMVSFAVGWRYGNGGMVFSSLALAAAYFAFLHSGPIHPPQSRFGPSAAAAVAFLLPFDLALFSLMARRRPVSLVGLVALSAIALQAALVLVLCPAGKASFSWVILKLSSPWPGLAKKLAWCSESLRSFLHMRPVPGLGNMPALPAGAFFAGFVFLMVRFFRGTGAMTAGFLGALVAAFLGVHMKAQDPSLVIYYLAAALILIVAALEASFFMAYIDELTLLPGRRSLNETLAHLGRRFAIAMIDVDHFKKFNDTWGHKTGDEVLKMIAARLKEMSGGAKVFRYGGEEFTAIFPGKGLKHALAHLEKYRRNIETNPFVVRSKGRRKSGPEERGKKKEAGRKKVKVTVSIGAAEPVKGRTSPKEVLKAADKALYKAKRTGRNRVAS
jgi:diguanylate cyclase (GGDEF)-like protein